ncbi:hypothetical protein ZHAS_00010010 [Anopheles sinensis]|uniref:Uncharacterized protein n=1 Tax=Anopheles sinensis TaxID=74873 RepID=A0A084VWH8_ANOSI|nr:hypothetical protein ZHAS_00010010 [Anopheles sinensis]
MTRFPTAGDRIRGTSSVRAQVMEYIFEAHGQLVKLFRNRKISHCPTLEMKVKAPAKRIFRRRVSKQSLESYPKPK